ncbi:MAG TPA: alpha-glucosidase [Caulobacteraceae bacterium]|nr:alpha-glucosidase [Caulobacteraceae bacterium]
MADARSAAQPWWKSAVVYQIYPRSFMDSDGDGVGDLKGVIARLDHVQALGVDVVWLSPHFDSPGADNGYDIRDYRKVLAAFGSMADFDAMLAEMTARGLRLIIDLVANHTSDEHCWFVESRRDPTGPYGDFYIWADGKDGGPPNNYPAIFGGSAWTWDAGRGQYYLHLFTPQQPDLNWDNPRVRAEIYDLMRFWLDKGVAGFRMDVIAFISKTPGLPDLTPEQLERPERAYACGPRLQDYLREMQCEALAGRDSMTVGEAFGVSTQQLQTLVDERHGALNMAFDFALVDLPPGGFALPQFKAVLARQDRLAGDHGWNAAFLGNHDQPRAVSHFGDDDPAWRMASAKTLATVLLTLRGTPFIYQGEEIAMANAPFAGIDDFQDVWAKTLWREKVLSGRQSAEAVLRRLRLTGRDNARTPMQWDAGPGAGFTTGAPWLKLNPDAAWVNVQAQAGDPNSVLAHYRRLIALRKAEPALVFGAYRDLDPEHPAAYAFTRTLEGKSFLILSNFCRAELDYELPAGIAIEDLVLSSEAIAPDTAPGPGPRIRLVGWASAIFEIAP